MTYESNKSFYDACVIGSGPAGLTAALELANSGLSVVLVESGISGFSLEAQSLSDAEITSAGSHINMMDAVQRCLGGTSALWGGRCVPLDPIDFETRSFIADSGWPITSQDIEPYYSRACEILIAGSPKFRVDLCDKLETSALLLSSYFVDNDALSATTLERWSAEPNLWIVHGDSIRSHKLITLVSGYTCIAFRQRQLNDIVSEAIFQSTARGKFQTMVIKAAVYIIACGGVETTRLVLNSVADPKGLKIQSPEIVGKYYMGHPSGKIAEIELSGDPKKTIYNFEKDGATFVRRRITLAPHILMKNSLLNISFWLENPPLMNWQHRSGILSAAYLALLTPFLRNFLAPSAVRRRVAGESINGFLMHILNCARSPLNTIALSAKFIKERFIMKPKIPGFFTYSASNRYSLHYHSEQAPMPINAVTLSGVADEKGLLKARINLTWSQQDIDSILSAHKVLDFELRKNKIGRLIYSYPSHLREDAIRNQAIDGVHQIGTMRMSADSQGGVTDDHGLLYGTNNCFIASSAVFPTSGQANPTLAIVAFTVRQSEYIAKNRRKWDINNA
jgi:choline dehydrogenase-like flavoprotein